MSEKTLSITEYNRRVCERDECEECGGEIPNGTATHRYAQASGVIAGPFCSSNCYWEFIGSDSDE
jgi:hypothetical protein